MRIDVDIQTKRSLWAPQIPARLTLTADGQNRKQIGPNGDPVRQLLRYTLAVLGADVFVYECRYTNTYLWRCSCHPNA